MTGAAEWARNVEEIARGASFWDRVWTRPEERLLKYALIELYVLREALERIEVAVHAD